MRKPMVIPASTGTTIYIGKEVSVEIHQAYRGRAVLHVYAPNSMDVDHKRDFAVATNNDGPSAPTLEPSAKKSVIDQDSGITHGDR